MSLFKGTANNQSAYVTKTDETPKWMQDAIYNQIQTATNIGNIPYQDYNLPTVAELGPLQQQAYEQIQGQQGAWQPGMQTAQTGMQGALSAPGGLAAANPYLQAAGQSTVQGIQDYMNPYTSGVTDRIAQLGARNLSENLLPQVSDQFIRAGQFGGSRMGEFGARALRDTQESVLGQQSQALQQGYGQALGASQADLARQAQLGQTQGALTNADLQRQLAGYQQMADLTKQQQGMGLSDSAALEAAGRAQQGQEQAQLDAAYRQSQAPQDYMRNQADWMSTQIRGMAPSVPVFSTQQSGGTGQTYSPSGLAQLASAYTVGQGINKLG